MGELATVLIGTAVALLLAATAFASRRPKPELPPINRPPTQPDPPPPPEPSQPRHAWDRGGAELTVESATALIRNLAATFGVPFEVITGIVATESAWNPSARGGVGELGLMQLQPIVARTLLGRDGFHGYPIARVLDPSLNMYLGTRLLEELRDHIGLVEGETVLERWRNVIQAYNTGEPRFREGLRVPEYLARVERWVEGGGLIPAEGVA